MIPNQGTVDQYLIMTPRSQWSNDFLNWIQEDHRYDQEEMEDGKEEESEAGEEEEDEDSSD